MPISPRLHSYDHILLDLDGCLWVGDEALPGAADAVAALRDAGKSVLFLTNDVRHPPEGFVRKLWRLGFQASVDEVLSVGAALQFQLAEHYSGTAYVLGAQAFVDHVADAGLRVVNQTPFATRADIVVVAGHDDVVYEELKIAAQAVLRGGVLVGATRDASFPMPDGPWPGAGAILAAVEVASGHQAAFVCGKPELVMYEAAADRLGPGRILGIGDRIDADVAGARRAGHDQALVLTGVTSRAQAEAAQPQPTFTAASLADLVFAS